jgi:hypothetical protein
MKSGGWKKRGKVEIKKMFNLNEQDERLKNAIAQMLKAKMSKSEMSKATGLKAEVLNQKIKEFGLKTKQKKEGECL